MIFGKLAEIAAEYLQKGAQVYIEGSLQTRKWQDQQGLDRYSTEVVVSVNGTMQMLGSRGEAKQKAAQQPSSQPANKERKTTRAVQPAALPESEEMNWNEEIPF